MVLGVVAVCCCCVLFVIAVGDGVCWWFVAIECFCRLLVLFAVVMRCLLFAVVRSLAVCC